MLRGAFPFCRRFPPALTQRETGHGSGEALRHAPDGALPARVRRPFQLNGALGVPYSSPHPEAPPQNSGLTDIFPIDNFG